MIPTTVELVLEGPPGAGKTTLLGTLVPALGDTCLFFSEPNVKLTGGPSSPISTAAAAHTLWYLRQEKTRARILPDWAASHGASVVVSDRNHLGVLAYCYATRRDDALPYGKARDYYQRHIAPLHYGSGLRTVILLVSVSASLHRRGGQPAHPRWRQWYDPGLLERMREFYLEHAPALCPNLPMVIDTDPLDHAAVLGAVAAELAAAGAAIPTGLAPAKAQPGVDERFFATYDRFGGSSMLGGPVTGAFAYRGGQMQMFELASLHKTAGLTALWDPLGTMSAEDLTGAAS